MSFTKQIKKNKFRIIGGSIACLVLFIWFQFGLFPKENTTFLYRLFGVSTSFLYFIFGYFLTKYSLARTNKLITKRRYFIYLTYFVQASFLFSLIPVLFSEPTILGKVLIVYMLLTIITTILSLQLYKKFRIAAIIMGGICLSIWLVFVLFVKYMPLPVFVYLCGICMILFVKKLEKAEEKL